MPEQVWHFLFKDVNGSNSNPIIIDSAGTTQLFSGSKNGHIFKFGNIDGNLTGTFSMDSNFQSISEGANSIISIADINNDNKLDMLIGNQSGGLTYFDGSDTIVIAVKPETNLMNKVNLYPNPTNNILNIDLGIDLQKITNIEVINLLGKTILSKKINTQKTTITLNNYGSGIYLVKISNDELSKVYKVVKE